MALCAVCGLQLSGDAGICPHHQFDGGKGDGWAEANRIWCAYFHRGVPIPRLTEPECDEGYCGEDYAA